MNESVDVAIIGAGTAGLSALREVRKHTERFVLINAGPYGTTCARVGCMPSKVLIECANAFHHRNNFDTFGIEGSAGLRVDIPAVLRRVRDLRDDFVAGILNITNELGTRAIAGRARFVGPNELDVDGRRVHARRIIIATGSSAIIPTEWSTLRARVFTSDTLFDQIDLPPRIAVIGLGVIGVEIAQALSRLGLEVTAFGTDQQIGGIDDAVVNNHALELLRAELPVYLGERVSIRESGTSLRIHGAREEVEVDAVFAALGRRPNVAGMGLENLGIALDRHGSPMSSPHSMQVGELPIYIAGDVSNDLPVLHVANDEGHIAGYNAARGSAVCFKRRVPLTIVFSDPNIANVGARLCDLDRNSIVIGEIEFSKQGRARVAAENHGVLRLYADRASGLLLGAEMCAPRAEHMAQLLAYAIQERATVHSLLRMPFYHPVFEEGLRTALRDASRQLSISVDSDLASCEPLGAAALD